MRLRGQCECGAVAFTVGDEFEYASNCHCANCRASTGSAFKPFGGNTFVGSKAPWYEIRDDLPQFDRYPS